MHNEFTAIFERDGEWFIAYCPEIPGANGQGRTKEQARESLAAAIALILADRREDGLRAVPPDAERTAAALATARLCPEARGRRALALDQSRKRRGRSGAAPHRDFQQSCSQDLSRSWRSRDRLEIHLVLRRRR
jgi:predicted RNase H-like HicB family nuclease